MSDVIRLLPDSVANQIAAGEVIQRPASVIKELVENSIDAGATAVTIILKDAGRTLIQVIDDGCGMSDTDARLAFERHATSKIRRADDLFALSTMGFRGEALASIAAISHVDLRTMLKAESIGTRLKINGSKVESQEPEVCVPGSNLMVKDLFYNVPARRKFLKKDSVELAAVMREFERLALVNIGVDFTLISNDATLHSLRRASMKQRISDLFGKNLDRQLIPVETDTSIVRLSGFVGLPEHARRRNPLQYFMVNGRNMRHPYFHKAILQCYENLIAPDVQPNYFINFHVDPETIDVNIHPTKNEIKFENEQAIWQILTAAVRDSLGRFNAAPAIDFDVDEAPEIPVFNPDARIERPDPELDRAYNPFAPTPAGRPAQRASAPLPRAPRSTSSERFQDWEKLYDDFVKRRDMPEPASVDTVPTTPEMDMGCGEAAATAIQLKNTYILTPSRGGLMIIDQHRAHLRILYDAYLDKAREHTFTGQRAMFPETVELSGAQSAVLSDIRGDLSQLGFSLEQIEGNTWQISAHPASLSGASPRDALVSMIESVTETGQELAETMQERLALSMARSSAIRRGQALTQTEIDRLISDLFRLSAPARTPDGHQVFTILPIDDISSLLG